MIHSTINKGEQRGRGEMKRSIRWGRGGGGMGGHDDDGTTTNAAAATTTSRMKVSGR
jgi:hypothetical protein